MLRTQKASIKSWLSTVTHLQGTPTHLAWCDMSQQQT